MVETWVEEKKWESIREKLPKRITGRYRRQKGKIEREGAMEDMILGSRKELMEEKENEREEEEGVIWDRVKYEKGNLRIVGVYVNGDLENGIRTIIGGDFNARTGEESGRISVDGEKEEETRRRSKDKRINGEGEKLIDEINK
ncbi:hypothetical protein P5V15_004380 [Pogonomyrmex californicus]